MYKLSINTGTEETASQGFSTSKEERDNPKGCEEGNYMTIQTIMKIIASLHSQT